MEGSHDLMAAERAFLRERLALVEETLAKPDRELIYVGKGRVRRQTRPSSWQRITPKREARLLRKLLRRSREGHVLATLQAWRCQVGEFLRDHRQRWKAMQEAYDDWWRLPFYKRESVPGPPRPPSPRYVDQEGAPWIVDDRFLALLDDLIERLHKWRDETQA